jgi:hypothetical protein
MKRSTVTLLLAIIWFIISFFERGNNTGTIINAIWLATFYILKELEEK